MAAHLTANQWSLVWIRLLFSSNACGELYCTPVLRWVATWDGTVLSEGQQRYTKYSKTKFRKSYATCPKQGLLTLIRAAGGVYDFRKFEEVNLCNSLSSELQNLCIP